MGKKSVETMTLAQKSILDKMRVKDAEVRVRWDHEKKIPAHISGKLADPVSGSDRLLSDAALEYLGENKVLFRMSAPEQDVKPVMQVQDEAGNHCVALQQFHKGVPVEGGTMRVQFDQDKVITRIANKFVPDIIVKTKPVVKAGGAVKTALKDAKKGKPEEGYAPELVIHENRGKQYLAWIVHIDDFEHNRDMHYYINAKDGSIIKKFNSLTTVGTGVYSGTGSLHSFHQSGIYKLIDNTRTGTGGPSIRTCDMNGSNNSCGNTSVSEDSNDNWNNTSSSPRKANQGAEVDVHRYMGQIVDYYKNNHNWNSIDNAGATIYSGVHRGFNYNNAFFRPSEKKFYFGDGDNSFFGYLTAKDVIAHEFTHAVTAHNSKLGYPDDYAGGLNEAFSDIFASFVDSDDTDMGDEVTTPSIAGDCLRRMNNPSDPALSGGGYDFRIPNHVVAALDTMGIGYKDTVYNPDGSIKEGDPHVNCGPVIYAAFFMLLGGTHPNSGITVDSIGYNKTARIFWHVQHVGLLNTPNATFLDCREAAVNAVNSIFKTDLNYLRIMDSVKNAFTAVGIGPDIYVRDSLSDVGTVPSVGTLCRSPDIITRSAQVVNPASTLGDMTRDDLAEDVEFGQNNYVYVRLQNRGAVSGDVTVTVYWSATNTFGTPSLWHKIGDKNLTNVQPSAVTFVEFEWSAASLPPLGHYCLVCELDDNLDPAPDKTLIVNGAMYSKFIAESNNYAWKNISVTDVLPAGLTGMSFVIHGHGNEDNELRFDLNDLPDGTDVHVRLLRRLCEGTRLIGLQFEKMNTRYCYYTMAAGQECIIGDIPFDGDDPSEVNLYIKIPKRKHKTYEVSASQYVNGSVVGRVTRIFNVLDEKDFDFIGNINSMEVHRKGCKWIGKMSAKNKKGFRTLSHAHIDNFDNCAFCIGDSKR